MMGQTRETTIEWCTPMLHLHRDCSDTQLIPAPTVERISPVPDTREHALWVVQSSRLKDPWDVTMNLAFGKMDEYPELSAVYREAWVEVNLLSACRRIAESLAHGQSIDVERVLGGLPWPSDEPDPLQPLRDLAAKQGAERTQETLDTWYAKAEQREKEGDFSGADQLWQGIANVDAEFRDAGTRMQAGLDVFISYASADLDVVELIFERLRCAGYRVWFDRRQGQAPDAVLNRCRHIILCLSDEYLARRMVPSVELRKTIPVVVRRPLKQAAPPQLRTVSWVDLTNVKEHEAEYRRLTASVSAERTVFPFASPVEVQTLQRLANPDRVLAGMKRHARDVYKFLFQREIGGIPPDDTTELALSLMKHDRLPPDVQLHIETIQRYAPLIEVRDIGQASVEPALQALYRLVGWASNRYGVHSGADAQDPLEAVWRHLAKNWHDGSARLPNSKWELAEGRRQIAPPAAIYPARNVEEGSAGDLLLLPGGPQITREVDYCRSLSEPAPIPISDAGEFDAEEGGEWQFLVIPRQQGCTLEELRERFQPLPESVAIAAARQIAGAFRRLQSGAPILAGSLFRYDSVVLDRTGAARLAWNWTQGIAESVLGPGGWSDLRSALFTALDGIVAADALTQLAMAPSVEQACDWMTPAVAPPAEDQMVLQAAVECWIENKPLPAWITDPPPPLAPPTLPPPPAEGAATTPIGFRLAFRIPVDCQRAWPLDENHIVVWQSDQVLTVIQADGRTLWRDDKPVRVRRAVASGQALAIGGWKGELRWFGGGHLLGADSVAWTIGDIQEYQGHWIAGSWNGRLQLLDGDGASNPVRPAPEDGVYRIAVSRGDRWAVLSMRGAVSVYQGIARIGHPEQIPGAQSIGFASGRVVVLTDQGLVTVGAGHKAGRPDKLPARGALRLLAWSPDETCLLVNESGQSWIVDRTGTYPRGPRLPGGDSLSVACGFRRCVVAMEGAGYAYWRDEFKVRSWPEAVSVEISADGCRVVVALPSMIEVYQEDLA